jgi:hypothetical protein
MPFPMVMPMPAQRIMNIVDIDFTYNSSVVDCSEK